MTSSITPLVAMQGTLEKMADKFKEALPSTMDEWKLPIYKKKYKNKHFFFMKFFSSVSDFSTVQ